MLQHALYPGDFSNFTSIFKYTLGLGMRSCFSSSLQIGWSALVVHVLLPFVEVRGAKRYIMFWAGFMLQSLRLRFLMGKGCVKSSKGLSSSNISFQSLNFGLPG